MTRSRTAASPPDLQTLQQRALSFLSLFEPPEPPEPPEPQLPEAQSSAQLRALAASALELAAAFAGDAHTFAQLDERLAGSRFAERLLDLPSQLADANQTEQALELTRALAFIAPDALRGDEALILANAGRREQALALVASNLAQAKDIPTAEAKAGDVYRALGEADAAEAYYRRALAESRSTLERSEAVLRIVSLLSDTGRERHAAEFLAQERARQAERPAPRSPDITRVGRNEPCPCGSGKKYKKCHGA